MDPELPQRAAARQPTNYPPRAGVDIDALLADLKNTYPEYLEYFVRADAVATVSAGEPVSVAPRKERSKTSLDRLHRRALNASAATPTHTHGSKSTKQCERTSSSSSSAKSSAKSSSSSAKSSSSSAKALPPASPTRSLPASPVRASSSSSRAAGAQPNVRASARPQLSSAKASEPQVRPKATLGPSAPPTVADCGEDIEMSSPTTQHEEGFVVVASKSQKRKLTTTTKSQADPPVKVFASAKRASSRPKPSQSTSATSGDSNMEEPTAERVPPLYVREKAHWDKLVPMLDQQGISILHARSTAIGIRVQCPDSINHRYLSALLRKENIGFHTYALQDERVLRAVIKGLPRELDSGLIKEDLVSQKIPVIEVHRMYQRRSKQPYDMVLVIAELSDEGKRVFDLKSVCRLSGLKIEEPKGRGRHMQCHNCQLYGHGARYCHARPRCVKCLEGHLTSDCPRKHPTEEPPSCVLCGSQGHPANYRGCPKAPKDHRRKGKAAGSRSAPPPAPKFVPAPPPATNAWSKPLYRPKPAQATATSGPAPTPRAPADTPAPKRPKTNAAGSDDSFDSSSLEYLNLVVETVDLDELDEFFAESKINPLAALRNHSKLIRAIKALHFNV